MSEQLNNKMSKHYIPFAHLSLNMYVLCYSLCIYLKFEVFHNNELNSKEKIILK